MHSLLISCLNDSGTILTPSRRLSAHLAQQYSLSRQQQAWSTPSIMTLEDWLALKWQQLEIQGSIQKLLLNQMQSIIKLENIIKESESGKRLYKMHETAKMVYEAWFLLHQYLIDRDSLQPTNQDEQTFLQWTNTYQEWLKDNQYIDKAQWLTVLLPLLKTAEPQKLCLYGFEELSPVYQLLFANLADQGWTITQQSYDGLNPKTIVKAEFADFRAECQAAAQWAKEKVQQGLRVACVCPTLTDNRDIVETVFRNTFAPLAACDVHAQVIPDFNLSAAVPLNKNPIIAIALKILGLSLPSFTLNDYAMVLNSPFCKDYENEKFARSEYAKEIRETKLLTWDLSSAFAYKIKNKTELLSWQSIIKEMVELSQSLNRKASLNKHKTVFEKILLIFGWPGCRKLTSVEYQIINRWHKLLEEFCQYNYIVGEVGFSSALALLVKLAANTAFQAENKHAKVQVLGLLEAIGQPFDAAWIMGLDNKSWPPYVKPNPFIPIAVQLAHHFPHSSQEREMTYATMLTTRLMQCAENIVFSYSQSAEGHTTLSSLISVSEELATLNVAATGIEHEFLLSVESYEDDIAPALQSDDKVFGKVRLLEMQAHCPFKAFAEIRLQASSDEESPIWLSAKTTGIILHAIVQDIWHILKDQKNLLLMTAEKRHDLLIEIIDKQMVQHIQWEMPALYWMAEKQRLLTLMEDYLELEKSRKPFQVSFVEKSDTYTFGNMQFRLRSDRIDQDSDGNTIIIDYKTGKFTLSDLWSPRLLAPQLPLYYFAMPCNHKAVMVINLTDRSFIGLSENEIGIEGVKPIEELSHCPFPDFNSLLTHWSTQLHILVEEFQNGVANVTPIQGEQTCRHCQLGALCRIKERMTS